jgi:hypothetical protein
VVSQDLKQTVDPLDDLTRGERLRGWHRAHEGAFIAVLCCIGVLFVSGLSVLGALLEEEDELRGDSRESTAESSPRRTEGLPPRVEPPVTQLPPVTFPPPTYRTLPTFPPLRRIPLPRPISPNGQEDGGSFEGDCDENYTGCVPIAFDVDCEGGSGDGPEYTDQVEVVGYDVYGLDANGDGYACE